ncbi:MAG TPA: hypothetical protein VJ904_01750, partial [Tichowtungia sp.]|nr:hypothetical protein [Tichowtungia sp.]
IIDEFTDLDEYSGLADDYTGGLFGFIGRTKNDGDAVNNDGDTPTVVNIESFSIVDNDFQAPELDDYEQWLEFNGLPTDAEGTNDYDSDGVANLYEYGTGGNPDDDTHTGTAPTFTKIGDSFIYVHPERSDTDILTYTVETTTNLVSGIWTAAGYTIGGTNVTGDTLDFVSNTVTTVEDEKFIRLKIEKQ